MQHRRSGGLRNGSKLIRDLGLDCDAWAHHLELTSTAVGWQEDILIGVSDKPDNQGYCDFHNQHLCSVYFALKKMIFALCSISLIKMSSYNITLGKNGPNLILLNINNVI